MSGKNMDSSMFFRSQCERGRHESNLPKGLHFEWSEYMEDWMSGLNQRFTKPSAGKTAREFESHILRQVVLARDAYKTTPFGELFC